jgi:hypothetical protein
VTAKLEMTVTKAFCPNSTSGSIILEYTTSIMLDLIIVVYNTTGQSLPAGTRSAIEGSN